MRSRVVKPEKDCYLFCTFLHLFMFPRRTGSVSLTACAAWPSSSVWSCLRPAGERVSLTPSKSGLHR
jgi:hypothetical protein